ncbi:MAG: hypothetical protein KJ697_01830 [Nanoarchaeota archaeon]|nr:hypothetical protein [Nanoarchaeota archaeon]
MTEDKVIKNFGKFMERVEIENTDHNYFEKSIYSLARSMLYLKMIGKNKNIPETKSEIKDLKTLIKIQSTPNNSLEYIRIDQKSYQEDLKMENKFFNRLTSMTGDL